MIESEEETCIACCNLGPMQTPGLFLMPNDSCTVCPPPPGSYIAFLLKLICTAWSVRERQVDSSVGRLSVDASRPSLVSRACRIASELQLAAESAIVGTVVRTQTARGLEACDTAVVRIVRVEIARLCRS